MALEFEPVKDAEPAAKRGGLVFEPASKEEAGKADQYYWENNPSIASRIGGGTKDATVLAGALAGGTVGAVGGGPPGAIAGGALGAAGGSAAYDAVRNALVSAGVLEGDQKKPLDIAQSAVSEGATEAAFGAGAPILARLWAGMKAKGLGVSEAGAKLADFAREHGINLGVSDVSTGVFPRAYESVAGVFPYIGSPTRKAMERKVGEVAAASDSLISGIGTVRGVTDVGEELGGAARAAYKEFNAEAKTKYDAFRSLAEQTGATMPTDGVRGAAQKFVSDYDVSRSAYQKAGGSAAEVEPLKEPVFITQARQIANLQPRINVSQYDGLLRDFDAALQQSRSDGFNFMNVDLIRRAAKDDFGAIDQVPVRKAREAADSWYAKNVAKFETPTARRFELTDRHLFEHGAPQPGTRNEDELLSLAFSAKSPKAMRDLRSLVGAEPMRDAVASRLEGAYELALSPQIVRGNKVSVIDPTKFRTSLGLDRPGSAQWKTLDEALSQAGSTVRAADLNKFVDAVEAAIGRGSPEPSTFAARRAVMGGAAGLETILPLGAMYATGNPSVLLGIWAARQGSKKLADPKFLRDITDLVHPSTPERYRASITNRIMKGFAAEGFLDGTVPP